jgi:hypothetical protein
VTLGGLGLFIIPARKRQANRQFAEGVATLRSRLDESLTRQFEAELTRSLATLRDAIAPYTRFVRSEHAHITALHADLVRHREALTALRGEIERLTSAPAR